MLEPYEAKVSRTVLRRGGGSNLSSLFGFLILSVVYCDFSASAIRLKKLKIYRMDLRGPRMQQRGYYPNVVKCLIWVAILTFICSRRILGTVPKSSYADNYL